MRLVHIFTGLLCVISQAWGLGLSWPGDGGIVSGQTVQISFDSGTPPYILTVLGFSPKNADIQLAQFTSQPGPNIQWKVNVPDGYVRFNVTDATGGSIISYWQVVYPDPNVGVSTVSVASTASVASAQSLQAYISGLSTSAQAVMTGSAPPQGAPTSTAAPASQSDSSSNVAPIVGGVVGGVGGLLAIALFAFWWVRRKYPQPSYNSDDGTTTANVGWASQNATDKESNMAQTPMPYNPYQQEYSPHIVSPAPTTPSQVQSQQMQGVYGGLPEIQGGYR